VPLFPKAFPAEYRPSLRGAKRNGGLLPALRADRLSLYPHADRPRRWGVAQNRNPFCLAWLATFGFVAELFVMKKQLFSGGENEICPAVNAFKRPVLEFHCELLYPSALRG
jgi:hypothetical protein